MYRTPALAREPKSLMKMAPLAPVDHMSTDPRALKIYIDGSALKNPGGAGGAAAWLEFPFDWDRPDEPLFAEGFQQTTNNRMELVACIRAFEYVRRNGYDLGIERILVVTDSKYVHEGFWRAEQWRKNGWRSAEGRPIENRDLWKDLLSLRRNIRVRTELKWMLGKKSAILKAVDESAKAAAALPWSVDRGFKPGQIGRSKGSSKRAASLFAANGQEAVIRIYRTRLVGRHDHKFYFEVCDEVSGDVLEKAAAFASADIALELHRQHTYRVLFNANVKYPIIERVLEEVLITALK
jgi:ribonuclease HI